MIVLENSARVANLLAGLSDALVTGMVHLRRGEDPAPVESAANRVRDRVIEIGKELDTDPIRLMVSGDLLLFQDRPLLRASLPAKAVIRALHDWHVAGLELSTECSVADVQTVFEMLRRRPKIEVDPRIVNEKLARARCNGIRALPPPFHGFRHPSWFGDVEQRVQRWQSVYKLLQDITVRVQGGGKLVFEPIEEQALSIVQSFDQDDGPLIRLDRCDQPDMFDHAHSLRVALLAVQLARTMTTDETMLHRVAAAALLHDIGKYLLPVRLLDVGPNPSEDEQRELARHAELGARFLLDHESVDPVAVAVAFGHHKSDTGQGYPVTRHAHELSMVPEIVKICDVYETLTSSRHRDGPMSPTHAYRMMISMRDDFHLPVLRRFIEVNGFHPRGQFIRIADGAIARVAEQGEDPSVPRVRLVKEGTNAGMFECDPTIIDLATQLDRTKWKAFDETLDSLMIRGVTA